MTQVDATHLAAQGHQIRELQDLVTLILKQLPRVQPWARQLAAHLDGVDRQIRVLGMTVSLKRSTGEIYQAAENVVGSCRLTRAALAGSRVDMTTLAALVLVGSLAERIQHAFSPTYKPEATALSS